MTDGQMCFVSFFLYCVAFFPSPECNSAAGLADCLERKRENESECTMR